MNDSTDNDTQIESLETWLSNKPYWEKHVWKTNFQNDKLADEHIDQCYKYLLDHLGFAEVPPESKPTIIFKNDNAFTQPNSTHLEKIRISEVKNIGYVNALCEDCSIKLGPHLTLIYGKNGSGKSGIARLLCNACFARGERDILPNVKDAGIHEAARATFVIENESDNKNEVEYTLEDHISDLKRFSVFDSQSVLIHLDKSNRVQFTPAHIKIFDKVADTISILEEMLVQEKNAKTKNNPFLSMFLDDSTSDTAIFCKNIDGNTKIDDFLKHITFNKETDDSTINSLQKVIDGKKKLDVPKRKNQLTNDRDNLRAIKSILQKIINTFSETNISEINKLVEDIIEKQKIVESLSVTKFTHEAFTTIGSSEWRYLISTAKELYEREQESTSNEPTHCILCHQELGSSEKSLFQNYWVFLNSKAKGELTTLTNKQATILDQLKLTKATYPKLLDTDVGVKILNSEDPTYLADIKSKLVAFETRLDNLIVKVDKLQKKRFSDLIEIDLTTIDDIIEKKELEENKLVDPASDIAILTAQLNSLKHRKIASTVKDAAIEYIDFCNWLQKANKVNFSGIKRAITKKRTESFLASVVHNYKGIFNQEIARLDCDFNLIMHASGDQGSTVKEFRLDFAEDYSPSQILSEGEQNACSLADFLTEVQLDQHNCGIIFDDPVSSLDHKRKDKIASRLVEEARNRQVVIFTHDLVFMSKLINYAENLEIQTVAHWIRKKQGIPGYVEEDSSPRLSNLAQLKKDSADVVMGYDQLEAKKQENAVGNALSYLRSACEALVEEILFAKAIQRFDDQIRITNLEEAVYDQELALEIVELHHKISSLLLAHNSSDQQREEPLSIDDLNTVRDEFDELEKKLKNSQKECRKQRSSRKNNSKSSRAGW